jgi:hypothetical protein
MSTWWRWTRWTLALLALPLVACGGAPRLDWPADVRAASARSLRIRPPEGWAPAEAAEAFHARGWDRLQEHWSRDGEVEPRGHCWRGTVRTVGNAGGDLVAADLREHGLEGVTLGGEPAAVGPLEVRADDRSLTACLPEARVDEAVEDLAGECAAFGEAIEVLDEAIGEAPLSAALSMDAGTLSLEVRWPTATLAADELLRRLASLGFEGRIGDREAGAVPRMRRVDDDWEVVLDLPPDGTGPVALAATTELPRRPLCGPEPLPPPR